MKVAFKHIGVLCSSYPWKICFISLIICLMLSLGSIKLHIENDPAKIWVPPKSISMKEQMYFDKQFGRFFRIEQLIFVADTSKNESVDVVQKEYLKRIYDIQQEILQTPIEVNITTNNQSTDSITLKDICYRPVKDKGCLIESPMQYWRNDIELLMNDPSVKLTTSCQSEDPFLQRYPPCMDENGIPVMKNVVFGGISNDYSCKVPDPCGQFAPKAKSFIITFLLLNPDPSNKTAVDIVNRWEKEVFLEISKKYSLILKKDLLYPMKLVYMAQRSVSDALSVETKQNLWIVIGSYIFMWIYISLSLGNIQDLIHSRCFLSILGVFIVVASILVSIGICSFFFRMSITMIVIEVVPFLILAIGVDNMFIITREFDRRRDQINVSASECIVATMIEVGPSITAAALSECFAFFVGVATQIPALQSFCVVAGIAVLVDYVLQLFCFTSALYLDAKRREQNRIDLFPYIIINRKNTGYHSVRDSGELTHLNRDNIGEGRITKFLKQYYTPFLFRKGTKICVIILYIVMLVCSVYGYSTFSLGLEQQVAVPSDFYLFDYFQNQMKYGEVGPPAYIVLKRMQYTDRKVQNNIHKLIENLSLLQPFVKTPIYSWLTSFNQWRQMRSLLESKINDGRCDCPSQSLVMNPFPYEVNVNHNSYNIGENITSNKLFYPLVFNFTRIPIDSACCQQYGFCGAQFALDINFETLDDLSDSIIASDLSTEKESFTLDNLTHEKIIGIKASRLRYQTTVLRNQSVYINSYYYLQKYTHVWSRSIPSPLEKASGIENSVDRAFSYSLYFVFYEQYKYIQGIALQNTLIALGTVVLAIATMTNLNMACFITWSVASTCLGVIGFLAIWNFLSADEYEVRINAVSVVNLIMAVGLSVEFCVHIGTAYLRKSGSRLDRSIYAVKTIGGSVFTGISLTKLCGISVLAFAPSHLYRLYFFRMYISIIIIGTYHGLALLPVLLSILGPDKSTTNESKFQSEICEHYSNNMIGFYDEDISNNDTTTLSIKHIDTTELLEPLPTNIRRKKGKFKFSIPRLDKPNIDERNIYKGDVDVLNQTEVIAANVVQDYLRFEVKSCIDPNIEDVPNVKNNMLEIANEAVEDIENIRKVGTNTEEIKGDTMDSVKDISIENREENSVPLKEQDAVTEVQLMDAYTSTKDSSSTVPSTRETTVDVKKKRSKRQKKKKKQNQ